jgi:beta-lactamase class C
LNISFPLRAAIVLVSAGMLPLASLAADDATRIRAVVDATILPLMSAHNVPGMAVAVTVGGKPYTFNYGLASKESKTPVTDATLFEMGSVSKVLTATLATTALVTGKLALSDHPGAFMAQLKGSAIDKATLLNLGTYTAGGLPLQFPDEVTKRGMGEYFKEFKPTAAPGVQRGYSNPSIGLFGHVAARALKNNFADAMEQQLFPQLGLKHTYIHVPQSESANYAWGYNRDNKPVRVNPGVFAAEAYGVKSTAADMLRLLQINLDPTQLDAMTRRAVEATHVGYFKVGEMLQGLGWELYAYPITQERLLAGNSYDVIYALKPVQAVASPQMASTGTLFNKTGSTDGFGSYVLFVPEKKIGIVLLANKNYPIPSRVKAAHGILEQLAQGL